MSARRARLVFEPLSDWIYPEVARVASPFSAKWTDTRDLLLTEADHLGSGLVVVELDLTRADLRQDGEIRANARLSSGKARISMDSRHGAMRFACDRYLPGYGDRGGANWWRHNVRAIALTLQALRAVDRYGAVHTAEQYAGFLAIDAPATGFASADEALRWVRRQAGAEHLSSAPRRAYREAARRLHPDSGGDSTGWERLDQARQSMEKAGIL